MERIIRKAFACEDRRVLDVLAVILHNDTALPIRVPVRTFMYTDAARVEHVALREDVARIPKWERYDPEPGRVVYEVHPTIEWLAPDGHHVLAIKAFRSGCITESNGELMFHDGMLDLDADGKARIEATFVFPECLMRTQITANAALTTNRTATWHAGSGPITACTATQRRANLPGAPLSIDNAIAELHALFGAVLCGDALSLSDYAKFLDSLPNLRIRLPSDESFRARNWPEQVQWIEEQLRLCEAARKNAAARSLVLPAGNEQELVQHASRAFERDDPHLRNADAGPETTNRQIHPVDVLLVVVTDVERDSVLEVARESGGGAGLIHGRRRTYQDLGRIGGARVALVQTEMGTSTVGGSLVTIHTAIDELRPSTVIMVGIAFGVDEAKQPIGQVLVTKQVFQYEMQRVGTDTDAKRIVSSRGDKVTTSSAILSRFRAAYAENAPAFTVDYGLLLSGESLVDNRDYRDEIRAREPEALGGEMEGGGLYVAAVEHHVDWCIAKAVCDYADGNKREKKAERQRLAALNAAHYVIGAVAAGGFAPESSRQRTGTKPTSRSAASSSKIGFGFQLVGTTVLGAALAFALSYQDQTGTPPAVVINAPAPRSVVVSQGQTGGQTANIINNYGPVRRRLSLGARERMVEILRQAGPHCAAVASTQGDLEAHEFKEVLLGVFREAGWDTRDRETFMFSGEKNGIVLTIPFNAPEGGLPQTVMQALAETGNPLGANHGDMAADCGFYLQVWHAPSP